jgi:hypothetical protein
MKKIMEKKNIHNKPYTHQTSVTKGKYYINKRCTNVGGYKNVKDYNEKKRFLIIYQRTKIKKLGNSKNEKAEIT